jgi:hypothetical protein
MAKLSWLSSTVIAILVSVVAVFLSAIEYQDLPVGAAIGGVLIFIATRYIRNTRNSFWQSTLVIIAWGAITYRAANPTAMGDLILIADDLTWWYIGITGAAAFISLVIPAKRSAAISPDEAELRY